MSNTEVPVVLCIGCGGYHPNSGLNWNERESMTDNITTTEELYENKYDSYLSVTFYIPLSMYLASIAIAMLICFTNILTITAICKFQKLKSATNYFIFSLSLYFHFSTNHMCKQKVMLSAKSQVVILVIWAYHTPFIGGSRGAPGTRPPNRIQFFRFQIVVYV